MEALSERVGGKFEKYGSTCAMEVSMEANEKMARPAINSNFIITASFKANREFKEINYFNTKPIILF